MPAAPLVTVVVPSHKRPDGLTTLLDALAAQTLARDRWELVVVHTYDAATARTLIDEHELTHAGVLRHVPIDPAAARPTLQRNLGWRAARTTLVAFTDDDCRPEPEWLERLVAAAQAWPGAIVQGRTRADPRDEPAFASPHVRTLVVDPPSRYAQTCNILYERAMLERLDGFDERFPAAAGEDIDLALRAQAAGAPLVGAGDAVLYHAVEALSLGEKIRANHKWQHLAYLVKRRPEFRRQHCVLGVWWKREHLGAAIALAALAGAPRRPWLLAGVWPYYMVERRRHGADRAAVMRAIREMPGHWLIELAEIATFARGSLRYRTFVL